MRAPLLGPLQLGAGEGGGEPVIPLLAPGEHEQVGAHRVGFPVLRLRQLKGELGSEHGLQTQLLGGFGEADDAVETVVIGDCERVEPEPLGLLGEILG